MAGSTLSMLLERGLRHFALGEVEGAVACWRQVLEADRDNRRAREYLELVATVLAPADAARMLGPLLPLVAPGLVEGEGEAAGTWVEAAGASPAPVHDPRPGAAVHAGPLTVGAPGAAPAGSPTTGAPGASAAAAGPSTGPSGAAAEHAAAGAPPSAPTARENHATVRTPAAGGADPSIARPSVVAGAGVSPSMARAAASAAAARIDPSAALDARIAGQAVAAWFDDGPAANQQMTMSPDPFAEPPAGSATPRRADPVPDPPPPAAEASPWQEWHSEVDFGTVEMPPLDAHPALADAASPGWSPGPGSTGWDMATGGPPVELEEGAGGDALDLVGDFDSAPVSVPAALEGLRSQGPGSKSEDADTLMVGARELFELGDFSGSLELVQKALEVAPDHAQAREYLQRNQGTLVQMYESKIGSVDTRPRVVLRPDEIVWLNLDHRAGFVLSQIDGTITVDDLYALSGLSRLDTAKILAELVEQGVIAA